MVAVTVSEEGALKPDTTIERLVRRFILATLVGLLTFSASGVTSLIIAEPWIGFERTSQSEEDGACPPTCVTCGCCRHAIETVAIAVANSPDLPSTDLVALIPEIPKGDPGDILHVPKPALAQFYLHVHAWVERRSIGTASATTM